MHTFKKLLLVTSCISSITLCTENQPHISNTLPAQPAPAEMSNGQIREGIRILNRHYHDIAKTLKNSNAQNEQFHNQMMTALHKATRTGWPFSARLIVLALSSFIAWEHKDTLKEALTTENAVRAWDQKEEIFNTVKESALTAFLKVKATMQKAAQAQPGMQEQKPAEQLSAMVTEASSTPTMPQETSEFENPNNQRED